MNVRREKKRELERRESNMEPMAASSSQQCCSTGVSVSPNFVLRREFGNLARLYPDIKSCFIRKRLQTLRESWHYSFKLAVSRDFSAASPVFCMDVDPAEQKYLLTGMCNGLVSVYDLESCCASTVEQPTAVEPMVYSHRFHRYLVTRIQWYPRDSSMFITSSMDRTVAIWDTNRLRLLDQFPFKETVTQVHWGTVPSCSSLIAVANLTSNIELIDPRIGEAIRNLRWKTECVSSVRWSAETDYLLLTGGKNGNVSLWDIRSGKSHLKLLRSKQGNAHRAAVGGIHTCDDGLHVVTMSIDRVIRLWNAYNMELVRTIKLEKGLIATPASNPTINFDVISSSGSFCACVPYGDDVLILELNEKMPRNLKKNSDQKLRYLLKGHFQNVNACIFRRNAQQVISSSNDKSLIVWSPEMDEILPDKASEAVKKLQQDEWSDED